MKFKHLFFVLILNFGAFYSFAQIITPLPKTVNSQYPELAPCISPDGQTLYFVRSHHPENVHSSYGSMDIWWSKKNGNGQWQKAVHASDSLNDDWANSVQSVLAGGNKLLVRGAYRKGQYVGVGWSYSHRIKNNGWSSPQTIHIPDYEQMQRGQHSSAFLADNGRVLLLGFSEVADSETSDLYVSLLDSLGQWSKPFSLGTDLNTPDFVEDTPFLAADGLTLYFASNRPDGFGGLDIYRSKRLDNTWQRWSKPENLGKPINTAASESWFSMPATAQHAYMVSYNPQQDHNSDLVQVNIPDWAKPQTIAVVTGKIYDRQTRQPISNATILYEQLPRGNTEGFSLSNPDSGNYHLALPYGNHYGIRVQADGYWPSDNHLDLSMGNNTTINQQFSMDFTLTPMAQMQDITIGNLFFEVNATDILPASAPALERLAELLKANPQMKIQITGHTDSTGNEQKNRALSAGRAEAVKNFLVQQSKIAAERLQTQGLGSASPVETNATEEGRQQNRRVSFNVIGQ